MAAPSNMHKPVIINPTLETPFRLMKYRDKYDQVLKCLYYKMIPRFTDMEPDTTVYTGS